MSNFYSVVIPMYNKVNSIEKTIESVLHQSYSNYEIVVVDDGSTDGSSDRVEQIKDDRIRLFHQSNSGVSATRNKGVALSLGDYVCFLDADDEWKEDFLETVDALSHKFPMAAILCPSYVIRIGEKEILPVWKGVNPKEDSLVSDFFEMASGANWIMNSSCVAVKKEILLMEETIFPNETVYEDFDLWIRLGSKYPVAHSNKVCSIYNRGITGNVREKMNRKVIYSSTYFHTLDMLKRNNIGFSKRLEWIDEIRDRRMVVFIYSLLNSRMKDRAAEELLNWHPTKKYRLYKVGLRIAKMLPYAFIDFIRAQRYKMG